MMCDTQVHSRDLSNFVCVSVDPLYFNSFDSFHTTAAVLEGIALEPSAAVLEGDRAAGRICIPDGFHARDNDDPKICSQQPLYVQSRVFYKDFL
jgi:hypothetical protein